MEKLLMLGTSNASEEIINCAKSRGIFTVVTDYLPPEKSAAKLISDDYWMISTADLDALEAKCREEGITAVISGVSEFNIGMSIELCKRLGLPCYTTQETWHYSVDKRAFKDMCIKNGVPVAQDYYVSTQPTEEELNKIKFPVVVKAIDQCANKGMSYCYSKEEVIKACDYARSFSKSETVIIEKMLKGREYEAYYAIADGEVVLLDLSVMLKQPEDPEKYYLFSTTMSDGRDFFMREINTKLINLLKDMGCQEGVAWIQIMEDEDDGHLYAFEMGYRLTGDMIITPIGVSHNFDPYSWMLDIAMGVKHSKEELIERNLTANRTSYACSYILWSTKGGVLSKIDSCDEIRKIPTVNITSALMVGDKVEKRHQLAAVTFNANDADEMIKIIKKVNDLEVFKIGDENVVVRYDDFENLKYMETESKKESL